MLFAITQAMSFFVIALIFWFGARLVSQQEYTTFQFFVALQCTVFGAIQSGNVFSFVPDMSSAKGAASDIVDLLDSTPSIDAESGEGRIPQNVQGRIRFENIHFRYPTRPGVRVLRDLNLSVEPGTYVALVGASGCGKSTTYVVILLYPPSLFTNRHVCFSIQLIERFYDPLVGTVYLDDQPISDLNVTEYRKHIALVSQEPVSHLSSRNMLRWDVNR